MGKYVSIKYLIPFLDKYKKFLILGILGILVTSLIYIPIPYLIGYIMDEIFLNSKDMSQFFKIIALIIILYFIKYIISILSKFILIKVEKHIINNIRITLIKKIMSLPHKFFHNFDKGYIQGRLAEVKNIGNLFSPSVISVIVGIFESIFSLIAIIYLSYKLSIVVVIIIPIFFIVTSVITKKLVSSTQKVLESESILNKDSFEIINGIEEIKTLNGKYYHIDKFTKQIKNVTKHSISQSKIMVLFIENIYILNALGTSLILLLSGILILNNKLTIGLYTSFSVYTVTIFGNIQSFTTINNIIKPICISIERFQEILNNDDEDKNSKINIDNINFIKINNIAFKYPNSQKYCFEKLNIEINTGDRIYIKGNNGSGKTSLMKLLLGLYKVDNGSIYINEFNINYINKSNLRKKIGIVSQKIFLFNGTILDNILYGNENKNRNDVEQIIDKYNLRNYILTYSNGLDTPLIQNTGVSGGQSQIIAYIRVLMSDKEILIFDEPFSNVDTNTIKILKKSMKILQHKFIFIISHESSTLEFINKEIYL